MIKFYVAVQIPLFGRLLHVFVNLGSCGIVVWPISLWIKWESLAKDGQLAHWDHQRAE